MVKIWYMDDYPQGDHRLPHLGFPPKYLTPDRLKKRTGVFLWKIGLGDTNPANSEGAVTQMEWITKEYKYVADNILEIKEGVTPRLNEKILEWYQPHMHTQDESRLILEGHGYYDVEEPRTGKWIRIMVERGDFIVIPIGCLHRFTTDVSNHIKLKRFYQSVDGEPHPVSQINCGAVAERIDYLARYKAKGYDDEERGVKKGLTLLSEVY